MQLLSYIVMLVTGVLAFFDALGAPAPAAGAAPDVVQWLDKLEARGREIRSFQANVMYDKRDALLADRQARTGQLLYIAGGEDQPPRFAVLFAQLIADGKVHEQKLEYLFDGTWLVEKDHKQKRFEKRQVVAPGEKARVDPLAIDGPFPVPLGQKRQEVLGRFEVTLIAPGDPDHPAEVDAVHLRLVPRADAPAPREQKKFDRVDLWFDRQTLLPVRVKTDEGAITTMVTLSHGKANELDEPAIARVLDLRPPSSGWRVEIKPWRD
jgi:hypothetical protein